MGRYPKAPWDFKCLYQHSCPYMDGHSTTWAHLQIEEAHRLNHNYWRLSDQYREEVNSLHKTIDHLEQENAQLKAQLKAFHQRQFKANRKPKNNKNTNATDKNNSRPRGAPKAHQYWSRKKPDTVDRTINVNAPKRCPHCQCNHLEPSDEVHEHAQEDIVLQPKTFVTHYKHQTAYCPKCRRSVFKDGPGELRNSEIGPVTKATAVYLRYGLRITYRQVQKLFGDLFNMSFSPATAMAFDRTATQKGLPLYEDLKAKIRQAQQIYADETYWRQDGQNGHVWYAGNKDVAVFHIAMSRASSEAIELLGERFEGSLVTDGYAAYWATNPKNHQTCLAHLIRQAREILQEQHLLPIDQQDFHVQRFCRATQELFQKACKIAQLRNTGQRNQRQTQAMQKHFKNAIGIITAGGKLNHQKAENLRQRIKNPERDFHRLFTFLKEPGLAATNNHAEQTLRTPVIFRKLCFGTRTEAGSLSHSVLPSLLVTATRQGNHPLQFFQTLFTQDTAMAQATLYHNSS